MATNPTATATHENEPETPPKDTDSDRSEFESPDDGLAAAARELGIQGSGTVRILKHDTANPGKTGFAMVCKVAASEFDPWDLGRIYGAGTYRFQLVDDHGRVRKTFTREILAPAVGLEGPGGQLAAVGVGREIQEIRNSHQRFLEQLVLAMVGRESGGGLSMSAGDLIKAFQVGRESAPAPADPTPHAVVFDALKLGTELAGQKENGGGNTMNHLLPKAFELVSKIVERAPASRAPGDAPALTGRAAPDGTPGSANAAQPIQTAAGLLGQYLPHILKAAQANRDPHVWGLWVADNTPSHLRPKLLELAGMDQAARHAMLTELNSAVVPYLGWIDNACEGIKDYVLAEPEDETDAAVSAGNVQAGDAATGAVRDTA